MSRSIESCPECGAVLAKTKKDRSSPQLRRFFAIVKAAFLHWPEDGGAEKFRPRSSEHLRFYLEMRAGHYTTTTTARIRSADPDKVFNLLKAFMRHSADERIFIDLDNDLLVQKKTLSIDYDTLDSSEFSRLKDAVCDVIKAEIGMDADRLLRETEKAA